MKQSKKKSMTTQTITTEMVYELLKEFKEDTHKRFERIENQQMEDHRILMELWENRSRQNLNFSSTYFLITFMSSVLGAILISFAN